MASADIENSAIAIGSYNGSGVVSVVSTQQVPVVSAAPQMSVVKSGVLNDDDGSPGLSAGDTISYSVNVSNPGNISLTTISISDPLVSLTLQGGDSDGDNQIDPGEIWTYTGAYTISASDITSNGGGDGDIDNTVTVSSSETGPVSDSVQTSIDPNVAITVVKTGVLNDDDGTSGLSAGDTVDYEILASNTGLVDLTSVSITDSLVQSSNAFPLLPTLISGDANSDNILNPGEVWRYTTSYVLTQANIDDGGNLINTATVTTVQTGPHDGVDTQTLSGIVEAYTMTKIANLVDGDGDNLGDVGEVINYTFRFMNTGNRTLANLGVNDPLPGLSAVVCANDGDVDGDIDLALPGQVFDCTASYTIAEADVISGSVTNTAASNATRLNGIVPVVEDNSANDNSTTTAMDSNFALNVDKTVVSATEILPNIVEIEYLISIENLSAVTHSNLQIEDDVSAAITSPAQMIGDAVIVSASGFSGPGVVNTGFNGAGNNQIFTGDVQLAPSSTGTVSVRAVIDRKGSALETSNTARVVTNIVPGGVISDDPSQTPGNVNDVNPANFNLDDADQDGAPDGNELTASDRDGDGIADAQDYDPTGYFYCEADGRILSGGLIAVENMTAGGVQTGLGTSNNITILRDGSAGTYQFFVSAPGRYRLIATLPPGGVASTTHTSAGVLDASSLLPSNPGVLGSGEVGNTGILSNFSAAANPFYTEFEIERGDPTIFNNNIPLGLCGAPSLAMTKEVSAVTVVPSDLSTNLTYRIVTENNGTARVDDLFVSDDLNAVFGGGSFSILSVSVESAPIGFAASANPFFNGISNTALLTNGGVLQPGEGITIQLQLNVDVPASNYTNTAVAGGVHPLTRLPIPDANASVSVEVTGGGATDGVVATKTTPVDSAPLGARVPYTISFENRNTLAVRDAELVDLPPVGFTYVPGTALVNGVAIEPVHRGQELVWPNQNIDAGTRTTLTLQLQVGAGVKGTEFTNSAFVRNSLNGSLISNRAKATIRLEVEAVFHCSHIIGRVFDDLDKDGYHDIGEPGLAGVRVTTVDGKLITTDPFGRYHIACDAVPDDRIGSNYILKLDERTLPTGYRVTSENPRVVRLTRGKLTKINFAAANLRRITLALNGSSFHENSINLKSEAIRDIARTLPILEKDRSVLELYYNDADVLKSRRLRAVKKLIRKAWKKRKRPHSLEIEIVEKR